MRSREEIEKDIDWQAPANARACYILTAILETNLDIRELLATPPLELGVGVGKDPRDVGTISNSTTPLYSKKDELFDEAVALMEAYGKHSPINARMLADSFHISYGRASTLIDQLEAAGVISAPDPITHRRKVV